MKRGSAKSVGVMKWIDQELARDANLRRAVESLLAEMRLAQDLVALRETAKMTQAQLAKQLRVSQPRIAMIESGKIKNLELRTLILYATALGGRVKIQIEPAPSRARATAARGAHQAAV